MKKLLCVMVIVLSVMCILASCNVEKQMPTFEISEDGYWVINGEKTQYSVADKDRADCEDGNEVLNVFINFQGLDFYLQDDGTYTVSCGNAKDHNEIVIPATYKGKAVTSIANKAFYECSSLTSIKIPDSITSIGDFAFFGCSSLESIEIPDSVTSIGYDAFSGCSNLTIYCEVGSEPRAWYSSWNSSNCPVVWNYKGE